MRVPSNLRSGSLGFNMTPMIDVVFQLIIFFLLSSHLAKQEVQMPLPLPTAESGLENVEEDVPRLTINVLADGSLLLSGRHIQPSELETRLGERLTEAKAAGSGLQVRIRGDRNTQYRHVEPILLACAHVGIWDVAFSVYRPEDVR